MMQSIDAPQPVGVWRVGLVWMGVAFLAWFEGLSMFFAIGWGLSWQLRLTVGEETAGYVGFLVSSVLFATILGAGAWVVVRHWTRSFALWMLLSVVGFTLGSSAGLWIAFPRNGDAMSGMMGGAVIGLIFGAAQWLRLRRLPRSIWWPAVNALAVAAAFWCAFSFGGEGREGIAIGLSSLAYSLITGAAVAWIFGGLTEAY